VRITSLLSADSFETVNPPASELAVPIDKYSNHAVWACASDRIETIGRIAATKAAMSLVRIVHPLSGIYDPRLSHEILLQRAAILDILIN
jgi:hypothetical protein